MFGRDNIMSEIWERGKNRLQVTSALIKQALSPTHTTDYDRVGTSYGEISSDEEDAAVTESAKQGNGNGVEH